MDNTFKIIGVGSPIVDAIAPIQDAFLDQVDGDKGGMVLVDGSTLEQLLAKIPGGSVKAPGGSAGNTLFALARLGATTALLGKTGNCANGRFYRERFAALGGDTSRFKIGATENGQCLSLVTPDGERTMRTNLGAAMTLAPDEISASDFSGCRHAHIEGYLLFNEALMMAVLDAAKAAGCTMPRPRLVRSGPRQPACCPASCVTMSTLSCQRRGSQCLYRSGRRLRGDGAGIGQPVEIAAVKIGARGSYIARAGNHRCPVPAIVDKRRRRSPPPASSTAGQQRELIECAHIGSPLGAAVVQQQGSALPESVWTELLQQIQR